MTTKHATAAQALAGLRQDLEQQVRDEPREVASRALEAAQHMAARGRDRVETAITLGYAAGFEAAREQAIAEISIICHQQVKDPNVCRQMTMALHAMDKGVGP